MKTWTACVLTVCGTVTMLAPWAYSAYHNSLVARILGGQMSGTVTMFNQATTALKWWMMLAGMGMVVAAIAGGWRRSNA